ncbi:MAG: amidohydrolase family protein [Chloroflexota bacterium]|nr:amidohydrolase family protein [Chloroflexota bacterium]
MPDMPIIDAHVHLWDPTVFRMPWLDGNKQLNRPYDLADYREQTAGLPIEAIVYLQVEVTPAYGLLEARWAADRAADDLLQAIVAWAPLEDGEACRTYLNALVNISPLIRGVRRVTENEPDPDFTSRPGFIHAVRMLPEFGLSCDLCIRHPHLRSAIALVRQCPETRFVLDHIAKPDIAGRLLDPWRARMAELASLPNVCCKISGIVTEADPARWMPDDLAPYVSHVLAVFGDDRVLYGGDWPVVLNASPYRRWAETLDALTSHFSDEAKGKLWAENARRFYRIQSNGQ